MQKKGQAALLTVLLGILGLTLGLSVASRSLSDLKQATYVDTGTKALAAAETAAEYGLNDLNTNIPATNCPADITTLPLNNISGLAVAGISAVKYGTCLDSASYSFGENVGQDEVQEVDFPSGKNGNTKLTVYWTNSAKAVAISVIYTDYTVARYAYYNDNTWNGTNFTAANSASGACFKPVTWNNMSNSVLTNNGSKDIYMIRVRPLGGSTPLLICGDSGIPAQNYIVVGKGVTTNNTTRLVQVSRSKFGALPAAFDNVLYSGGSISK